VRLDKEIDIRGSCGRVAYIGVLPFHVACSHVTVARNGWLFELCSLWSYHACILTKLHSSTSCSHGSQDGQRSNRAHRVPSACREQMDCDAMVSRRNLCLPRFQSLSEQRIGLISSCTGAQSNAKWGACTNMVTEDSWSFHTLVNAQCR
jgi:hypothetical protein